MSKTLTMFSFTCLCVQPQPSASIAKRANRESTRKRFRSFERWRSASLDSGRSVNAAKAHCTKTCCAQGNHDRGNHVLVRSSIKRVCCGFQSRLSDLLHAQEGAEGFRRTRQNHFSLRRASLVTSLYHPHLLSNYSVTVIFFYHDLMECT